MDCSLTEARKPPAALAKFFDDPPLLPSESREEYERLFSAIVDAAEPADAIAWLFTRDIADLSWEIRRERAVKAQVIASARNAVVKKKLTPIDMSMSGFLCATGNKLSNFERRSHRSRKRGKTIPSPGRRLRKNWRIRGMMDLRFWRRLISGLLPALMRSIDGLHPTNCAGWRR